MTDIQIPHRQIIDNLQNINTFGKQRAAAALFSSDVDHNLRTSHAELVGVMRAIAADRQLDQAARYLLTNTVQAAFTRLASPEACARGVPHQKLVASLTKLNELGKDRAAAALYSSDVDADLCVTSKELPGALRAAAADRQLDQAARNLLGNNIQLAFTQLSEPEARAGGFSLRPAQRQQTTIDVGVEPRRTMVSE